MCTHGPVAEQGAAGVAEARVGEHIVVDFIIPRLDQLQDRPIPVEERVYRVGTEEEG